MEKLGFEGIAILLILLPGFLCAGLIQALCVRRAQTDFDKVWEALLYSFVVYVFFASLVGPALPVNLISNAANGAQQYTIQLRPKALAELALISVVLALAVGGIVTNDLSGRAFRWLRLTQRTSRLSVWSDVFHDYGGVVIVEIEDGRRVEGWIRYYSDEPSPASVFLENAAWIDDADNLVPIDGPGILITESLGIKTIEFLRWTAAEDTSDSNTSAQ
jgi:hypothetical protein